MQKGYVKLYRSLLDWEWISHPPTVLVYIYLILKAEWQNEKKYRGVDVKRGQVLCSRKAICEKMGISEQQVKTAQKHLVSTGEITCEIKRVGGTNLHLYTVISYDEYQEVTGQITAETTLDQLPNNLSSNFSSTFLHYNKEIKNIRNKEYCSEVLSPRSTKGDEEPIFRIEALKGEMFEVFAEDIESWHSLYPAVDVEQQLRNMIGWLEGNPKNKKTKNGMPRFIHGWLSKEQNSTRRYGTPSDTGRIDMSYIDAREDDR